MCRGFGVRRSSLGLAVRFDVGSLSGGVDLRGVGGS